jgi:DNA repair exonuclease SbcCD ATPase subunit
MVTPHTADIPNDLAELLEEHVRRLTDKLSGSFRIEEVEAEIRELDALITTVKRRDEIVERLLDSRTPKNEREELRAGIEANQIRMSENRAQLMEIHRKSEALLLKSVRLMVESRRKLERERRVTPEYSLELCASCRGLGGNSKSPCPVCGGGTVLVHQPPIACPRCHGDGKGVHNQDRLLATRFCIICRGSGWVMTKDQ